MTVLSNRPVLRALIERTARRALAAVARGEPQGAARPPARGEMPEAETAAGLSPDANVEAHTDTSLQGPAASVDPTCVDVAHLGRALDPELLAVERCTVTRLLYGRLADQDVVAIEQLIRETPGAWEHYAEAADDVARQSVLLALGMWLEAESLPAKTGLVRGEPPEDVHAMTRGALAAAGGLYEADLVSDALISVGQEMSDIHSALDFGCSSGRVVRTLAAAYPGIEWHGCDPNAPAIAWASENLPAIEFFVNGEEPPLPLADDSLDLAYAISIWSHFAPDLGVRWFDELHRLLRPGGYLVLTTHGMNSVAYYALRGLRTPQQSDQIRASLYSHGWWYAPEFGEQGDWGVVNPEWGTAFLAAEWMLAQLCPRWRVLEFAPGRNQDNQDVYVLQRA